MTSEDKFFVTKYEPHVRWLREGDFQAVLDLDEAIFEHHWSGALAEEILLRRRNLTVLAEQGGKPVGFMVFEICRDRFYILKMGVLAEHRRRGVGTAMISFLKGRLDAGRTRIEMDVREGLALDGGFRFFQSHSFRGTGMQRDFFQVFTIFKDEPTHVEDAINFVFVRAA